MSPQQFLESVTTLCKLDWYYDGATLWVSNRHDRQSLVFRLNYATSSDLDLGLSRQNLKVHRFYTNYDEERHLFSVHGPIRYVEAVSALLRNIEVRDAQQTKTAVRIVRLRYAAAYDHFDMGVAKSHSADRNAGGSDIPIEYEVGLPAYSIDVPTNSVLVRDLPKRLDADVERIVSFDHKAPGAIIGITVADVSTSSLAAFNDVEFLARREFTASSIDADSAGEVVAKVGGRAHTLLQKLDQWAGNGLCQIKLSQTFVTQHGDSVKTSQFMATKVWPEGGGRSAELVRHRDRSDARPLYEFDFSLEIRPLIEKTSSGRRIDLCISIGQPRSGARESVNEPISCAPVPGTADRPHEVLDDGQALVVASRRMNTTQTRIVVIVPQINND